MILLSTAAQGAGPSAGTFHVWGMTGKTTLSCCEGPPPGARPLPMFQVQVPPAQALRQLLPVGFILGVLLLQVNFGCSGMVLDLRAYVTCALHQVAAPEDSSALLCMSFLFQHAWDTPLSLRCLTLLQAMLAHRPPVHILPHCSQQQLETTEDTTRHCHIQQLLNTSRPSPLVPPQLLPLPPKPQGTSGPGGSSSRAVECLTSKAAATASSGLQLPDWEQGGSSRGSRQACPLSSSKTSAPRPHQQPGRVYQWEQQGLEAAGRQ